LEERTLLSFTSSLDFSAGSSSPRSLVVADFNHDGRPDIAVANGTTPAISVLFGNGAGTLQAPASYANDVSADTYLTAADFTGDGIPDLAYTTSVDTVIRLNNGDGTFGPATHLGLGGSAIATGDFNHDGHPDLLIATPGQASVSVLLGTGTGTFQSPITSTIDNPALSFQLSDLNRDGIPDVVVMTRAGTVGALIGRGDGSFQYVGISTTAWSVGSGAAVADFNGDGIPDLAVALPYNSSMAHYPVGLMLGKGDGTFQAPVSFNSDISPDHLLAADLNGDGHVDLAVAGGRSNDVGLFLGQGDGTFTAGSSYAVGGGVDSLAAVDLNHDGRSDLAVAASMISVLLNEGGGVLSGAQTFHVGQYRQTAVVEADWNRDGKPDLAVASASGGTVSILTGRGDGTFATSTLQLGPQPQGLATGDFNNDGIPDLAVDLNYKLLLFLGKGDGTFQAPVVVAANAMSEAIAVGDFNGDHNIDLAAATNYGQTLTIYLGTGTGTFQPALNFAQTDSISGLVSADFNGDGLADLADYSWDAPGVRVRLATGSGNFAAPVTYATLGVPSGLAVGDLNNDQHTDLVARDGQAVSVLLGNGNGTFQPYRATTFDGGLQGGVVLADFNRDGRLDMATGSSAGPSVQVRLGNGDGTFGPAQAYDAGAHPAALAVGDWNGDGLPDIAAAATDAETIGIVLQTPPPLAGFALTSLPAITAGAPLALRVTAQDAYGNTIQGYTGTVHFSSDDSKAGIPADYTFTKADHGVHTFSLTLRTAGPRTVTVADGASVTISVPISVRPALPHALLVTGFPSPTATGQPGTFTVTATDAYGNLTVGYRGTVHFTSTDPQAQLYPDYQFKASDQGVHTFPATFLTAGLQTLTAIDTVHAFIHGAEANIVVNSPRYAVAGTSVAATEGQAVTARVGSFSESAAGSADSYTAVVRWGDGSSSAGQVVDDGGGAFHVTGSHTYKEEGSYPLAVTIQDADGNCAIILSRADVAEAGLSIRGRAFSATEGTPTGLVTVATFADLGKREPVRDYSATIDWGDGSTSTGTIVVNSNGNLNVLGNHTYANIGSYTVRIHVSHGGIFADATTTATVASVTAPGDAFPFAITDPAAGDQVN
jgi:hypothetical protein